MLAQMNLISETGIFIKETHQTVSKKPRIFLKTYHFAGRHEDLV